MPSRSLIRISRQPLKQKVKRAWNAIVKKMSDDKLYAFRELINGRFQAVKC